MTIADWICVFSNTLCCLQLYKKPPQGGSRKYHPLWTKIIVSDNHEFSFNRCFCDEENILCCSTWWLPAMGHLKSRDCNRRSELLILFKCEEKDLKQLCITRVNHTAQENSPGYFYTRYPAHFWWQISVLIQILDSLFCHEGQGDGRTSGSPCWSRLMTQFHS